MRNIWTFHTLYIFGKLSSYQLLKTDPAPSDFFTLNFSASEV
jgi:hypothetical protein